MAAERNSDSQQQSTRHRNLSALYTSIYSVLHSAASLPCRVFSTPYKPASGPSRRRAHLSLCSRRQALDSTASFSPRRGPPTNFAHSSPSTIVVSFLQWRSSSHSTVPSMSSASSASSSAGVVPPPAFLLEVCVDSVASARAAERAGASRVELCCALVEGGLTPSIGLIKAVRAAIQIPVMVLIRPRAGDFLYTRDELAVMREDIRQCRAIGRIDGVVFGLLQADGAIDLETTRDLVQLAHPMACTFHRAIDMAADIRQAARDLMTIAGIQRVLTSGGERDTIQGQQTIKVRSTQTLLPSSCGESNRGSLRLVSSLCCLFSSRLVLPGVGHPLR